MRRAAGFVLVLSLGLLPLGCGQKPAEKPAEGPGQPAAPVEAATEEAPLEPVQLYFPDDSGNLSPEAAQAPASPTEQRIRKLAEGLIAGPQDQTGVLHPILPKETTVGGVLVLDGIAYLDLRAPGEGPPPAVGSMDEQMILYSLVDTVILNTSGVEKVVLLWNGTQRETFAGHYDTTRPLGADKGLIAAGR